MQPHVQQYAFWQFVFNDEKRRFVGLSNSSGCNASSIMFEDSFPETVLNDDDAKHVTSTRSTSKI